MLMPNERAEAIVLLTNTYKSNMSYGGINDVTSMLTYGHKGFANFTDAELMRALQSLAKKTNAHDVNSFVQRIAIEKFVLE